MFYGFKFFNLCIIPDTLVIQKMAYIHFTDGLDSWIITQKFFQINHRLCLTFGGMWRWRRVAVARVFALVVRCRVMMLFLYSRVGKNRDTRRESPAGAGAACAAGHITVLFKPENSRGTEANDIYRPVRHWHLFDFVGRYYKMMSMSCCIPNFN